MCKINEQIDTSCNSPLRYQHYGIIERNKLNMNFSRIRPNATSFIAKKRYPRSKIERQLYSTNALCETRYARYVTKKNFRLFLRDFSSEIKRIVYIDGKLWPNACNLFPHRAGSCLSFRNFIGIIN